jgi:hypothetical protein
MKNITFVLKLIDVATEKLWKISDKHQKQGNMYNQHFPMFLHC